MPLSLLFSFYMLQFLCPVRKIYINITLFKKNGFQLFSLQQIKTLGFIRFLILGLCITEKEDHNLGVV